MRTDPNIAPTLGAAMLVGWLMLQAGLGKRMLDWRDRRPDESRSILRRSAAIIERTFMRWARG